MTSDISEVKIYDAEGSSTRFRNKETVMQEKIYEIFSLFYGFSKFSILIGWLAVRKNPYPDRGPYFPYLDRCPGCRLSGGNFKLCKYSGFLRCFTLAKLCVIKICR